MNIWISHQIEFSAAHFYQQKKWSAEKNKEFFGLCYTQYGHGHNYKLKIEIQVDSNLSIQEHYHHLKDSAERLKKSLDHKHLNFEIDYFNEVIPTSENIVIHCLDELKKNDSIFYQNRQIKIELFETPNLGAKISVTI